MTERKQRFRRGRALSRAAVPTSSEPPSRPGSDAPLIDFRRASMVHRDGAVGLDRATFAIARGGLAFVIGPPHSGKSTVLRLLTRELRPSGGAVWVAGRDLSRIARRDLSGYRRNLGLVRHDSGLMPDRSVSEQIVDALRVTGAPSGEHERRAAEILQLTGLAARSDHAPDQLTTAEHRRVCIARAFAGRPPLLLADDPARGLDREAGIGILRLLYRINRTGTTVLVATRDRDLVVKLRRRTVALDRGQVVADSAARPHLAEETTREFAARMRGANADPELDPAEARAASAVRIARALHDDRGQQG